MDEHRFERKIFYSVTEVAEITGCHRGRVLRWIHRRQMAAVRLEEAPLVPLSALLARLERIEASRARRRTRASAGREPASSAGGDGQRDERSQPRDASGLEPGTTAVPGGQSAGVSQTG